MIISQAKPKEELMDFISDAQNVLIAGCSLCASTCKVGGEEEIAALKTELEAVLKGDIEDSLPGWEVVVGPNESMQLPKFLKDLYQNA